MRVIRQAVPLFIKFDISGSFFGIGSSPGVDKGVHVYGERNPQVWNRSEQGDIRGMGLRRGRPVGEGGLAGAGVRRRICHRARIELGFGDARLIFLLDGGRACLREQR